MYNRYKFEDKGSASQQEMLTLPSITGDLTMKNSYMGIDGREQERPKIKIKNGKQEQIDKYIKELATKIKVENKAKQAQKTEESQRRVTTLGGVGFMEERGYLKG